MKKLLGVSSAVILSIGLFAGCDDDDNGGTDTTAASNTTASANTTAAPSGVSIDSFEVSAPDSCDGDQALAPATWTTTGADGVSFAVDGEPVPADAGNPPSGSGNVPIPCDGASHEVTITATGGGNSASDSQSVTAPSS